MPSEKGGRAGTLGRMTEERMRYAMILICCLLMLAGGCGVRVTARGQMEGGVGVGQGLR